MIKVYSNPVEASTKVYKQLTSKKVMVDVGKWSENFIYEYDKSNHLNSYAIVG